MRGRKQVFECRSKHLHALNAKRPTQAIEITLCPPLGLSLKTLQSASAVYRTRFNASRVVRMECFRKLKIFGKLETLIFPFDSASL